MTRVDRTLVGSQKPHQRGETRGPTVLDDTTLFIILRHRVGIHSQLAKEYEILPFCSDLCWPDRSACAYVCKPETHYSLSDGSVQGEFE
jgi:hypothetical protein